jgi:hypothetical protein
MKLATYKGRDIVIDAESKKFRVEGGELRPNHFASFDEATAAIDAAEKVEIKAKAMDLALDVLKHDGSGVTQIKGIHQREGNLLFTDGGYSKKARESYGGPSEVYPPVEWIKLRLAELAKIKTRSEEINRELRGVQIKVSRGFGFKSAEDYERAINLLRHEYEKACDAARTRETHLEMNVEQNLSD